MSAYLPSFLLSFLITSIAYSQTTNIGVLECSERPSLNSSKTKPTRGVRAVFYKKDNEWLTGDAGLKPKTDWTVTFNGKAIGNIQSTNTEISTYYKDEGLLKISSPLDKIPSIGEPTDEFPTFAETKTLRPLIVTTGTFQADPENWKVYSPSAQDVLLARKEFKKQYPQVKNCKDSDIETFVEWKYTVSDIKVLKSYTSNKNLKLISLQLGPYRCDGPPEDAFWKFNYVISPEGKVQKLEPNITLVDSGDYDGDGKEELIFQISGYNRGGYIIYWNDFRNSTDFVFSYH